MFTFPPWVGFLLKAVIGLALLWLVVTRIPLHDALAVASSVHAGVAATVIGLYFLAHMVNAAKLAIFLPHLSLWQAFRFTLVAILYGTALPGQIAGDAVKAVRLARIQPQGDAGAAVAAVAVDKIVGIFALLIFSALGLALQSDGFGVSVVAAVAALAVGVGVTIAAVFFLPIPAWLGQFGRSIAAWRSVSLRPTSLFAAFLLGLIFQALCIAIFMILGDNLNIELPVSAWAVIVGLISIVLMAPITIAGIGLREASLVALLGTLGASEVAALALSLVIFVLGLIGAAAGLAADLIDRDRA